MDDRRTAVSKKFEKPLKQTAHAAVELSRHDGTVEGVLHYSFIELHATAITSDSTTANV